jgi:hypothetical protein
MTLRVVSVKCVIIDDNSRDLTKAAEFSGHRTARLSVILRDVDRYVVADPFPCT